MTKQTKQKEVFPCRNDENGEIQMDPEVLDRRTRWLKDTPPSRLTETLEKERKPKSSSQLGYIFGCIIAHTKQVLDDRGEDIMGGPIHKDQIKTALYFQHHAKKGGTWENFHTYKTLSMHDDMQETSEFIDSCLHWLATCRWRIVVSDPRPQENTNE